MKNAAIKTGKISKLFFCAKSNLFAIHVRLSKKSRGEILSFFTLYFPTILAEIAQKYGNIATRKRQKYAIFNSIIILNILKNF